MKDRVQLTIEEGVAQVRLNRPDRRNGLDRAMFERLLEVGLELKEARDVRAVVLCGEGKAFCAGLDFMSFMAEGPEGQAALLQRPPGVLANVAQRVAYVWAEVPMPVIAAVHGVAFGGGLQIALAADVRFTTASARFCVMEIVYGLIPDMSITQTLPRLVRQDVARELVFTGREVLGTEAVEIGLATHLSEHPLADATAMARVIAGRSPHAVRAAKRLLVESADMDAAEALRFETELQLPLLGSANQLEAVQAAFSRRAPVFSDPE